MKPQRYHFHAYQGFEAQLHQYIHEDENQWPLQRNTTAAGFTNVKDYLEFRKGLIESSLDTSQAAYAALLLSEISQRSAITPIVGAFSLATFLLAVL